MGITCEATSAASYARGTLIVSHDPSLLEQLRRALEEDPCCRVQTASSYREAEQILQCC